jgi:hypothetical protein
MLSGIGCGCLETSLLGRHVDQEAWAVGRDETLRRFAALPDTFPYTKRYAAELTSGTALDRFDFTLNLILDGLGNRNYCSAIDSVLGARCSKGLRRCASATSSPQGTCSRQAPGMPSRGSLSGQ